MLFRSRQLKGDIFSIFVIALAAAEAAIGLSILSSRLFVLLVGARRWVLAGNSRQGVIWVVVVGGGGRRRPQASAGLPRASERVREVGCGEVITRAENGKQGQAVSTRRGGVLHGLHAQPCHSWHAWLARARRGLGCVALLRVHGGYERDQ